MTESHRKRRFYHPLTAGQFWFGCFAVFCLLLLLRNSAFAIRQIRRGLALCADSVIPSLFPFMVLSELIVSGGVGKVVLRRIYAPLRILFKLSDAACCACLLGLLCGFPVGATCAVSFYDRGEMTKTECERVLCIADHPSPAFLIGTVGVTLWKDHTFGIALYLTVLLSAFITAGLTRPRKSAENTFRSFRATRQSDPPTPAVAALFTHAVRSAAEKMLIVCAYVIFFSAFTGTLNLILAPLLSETAQAGLTAVFELSGGMSLIAAQKNTTVALPLCACAVGWSGLSVHCQVLSVCDGRDLSHRPYFLAKLFQSVLCGLLFPWILRACSL